MWSSPSSTLKREKRRIESFMSILCNDVAKDYEKRILHHKQTALEFLLWTLWVVTVFENDFEKSHFTTIHYSVVRIYCTSDHWKSKWDIFDDFHQLWTERMQTFAAQAHSLIEKKRNFSKRAAAKKVGLTTKPADRPTLFFSILFLDFRMSAN